MNKIFLHESDPEFKDIKQEWFDRARGIKTTEDFADSFNHLSQDYYHDYGSMVHAIGALVLAAGWLGAHEYGITGFQAGCVMWDFIQEWMYQNNECGLKLIDYDNMLYPQYQYKFEKTISSYTWCHLQEEAKKNLVNRDYAHPSVVEHWRSIVDGEVPFGYEVSDDK